MQVRAIGRLVARWEEAHTAQPYAWALMTAALEAARLGVRAALSPTLLRRAAAGYWTGQQRAEAPADWFTHALCYATHTLEGGVSALGRTSTDDSLGYTLNEDLLEHASRVRATAPVPVVMWEALLACVHDPADCAAVADNASKRLLYCYAVPLYRRAAGLGHQQAADRWAVLTGSEIGIKRLFARAECPGLGISASRGLAEAMGHFDDDLAALRVYAASGRSDAQIFSHHLVSLLAARGDMEELRVRADSGDEDAAYALANLLACGGDLDGLMARVVVEAAARPPVIPGDDEDRANGPARHAKGHTAARRLARFLAHRGDIARLEILANDDTEAAKALATNMAHRHDLDGLRRRADSGDPHAGSLLADLLVRRGDLEELHARAACGDETAVQRAARLLLHRDDLDTLHALAERNANVAAFLAETLADRGNLAASYALADRLGSIVTAVLCRFLAHTDIDALRARADAGDMVARERLADLLVHRDELKELESRAARGDVTARDRLVRVYVDRGDTGRAHSVLMQSTAPGDADMIRFVDDLMDEWREHATRSDLPEPPSAWHESRHLDDGEVDELWDTPSPFPHESEVDELWDTSPRFLNERELYTPDPWDGTWHDPFDTDALPASELSEVAVGLWKLRAYNAGDHDSCHRLAVALVRRGDLEELRVRANDGDTIAARYLAATLADRNDLNELDARAEEFDRWAAEHLADLLAHRGHIDELRAISDSFDPWAAARLIELYARRGDVSELSARANQGDFAAGKRWAEMLVDRGDLDKLRDHADNEEWCAMGPWVDILIARGDLDQLRARADQGDMTAGFRLVAVLADRSDIDELRARADAEFMDAGVKLAEILVDRGDIDELRARARAHDSDAAHGLVDLLIQRGHLDEAEHVLLAQVTKGDVRVATRLPGLLFRRGRHDEARRLALYGLNPDGSIARQLPKYLLPEYRWNTTGMLDFTELSDDGEDLELLTRELCLAFDFRARWSGRGPDGGRDLLLEEPGEALLGKKVRHWLVSCKHTARAHGGAGRSVNSDDIGSDGGIVDAVSQHGAEGYLLVCSTQPSSALVARLEAIERRHHIPVHIWDGVELERMLGSPRGWKVAQRFMPKSADASGWRIFATESPNRFIGITRGFYIRMANRYGSRVPYQLDSIDQRLDEVARIELPDGHELRPRGVFYNDKGGEFLWNFDYLYDCPPESAHFPYTTQMLAEMLTYGNYDDGQNDHFAIVMRRVFRGGDSYDPDSDAYYSEVPSFV